MYIPMRACAGNIQTAPTLLTSNLKNGAKSTVLHCLILLQFLIFDLDLKNKPRVRQTDLKHLTIGSGIASSHKN